MKISILDQSPVSTEMTQNDALQASVRLAQHGDKLGYARYWIAEHHDLFGLACPNPSVMLSMIGARTHTIRIGAGAVLLPYYKPFHIAETYNLLATLFPGRIDLGLGRAPGGSAEVSQALSDNYLAAVRKFSEQIDMLQAFLHDQFSNDHMYSKISPTPVPEVAPTVWLLGISEKSAELAVKKRLPYTFGHFMSDQSGPDIVQKYRAGMKKQESEYDAYVIIAVNVICARTMEEANDLALSYFLWKIRQDQLHSDVRIPSVEEAKQYAFSDEDFEKIEQMKRQMLIGDPESIRLGFADLDKQYKADEYMIVTIVHDETAKLQSYTLIKEVVDSI